MKKFAAILAINLILMSLNAFFCTSYSKMPLTSPDIRQNTQNKFFKDFQAQIVRVGIGNQNFTSYEHENAGIYATGEFEIYDNKKYITTYDSENVINVSTEGKLFVLTDAQNNTIAKISGPVRFTTDYGFLGIKNLKRAGKNALYRGQFELVPSWKAGKFFIINVLPVEEYLKGVVPNEMPVKFGLEALKAQCVAARNYVLSPRIKANPNFDVVDSVASQVYFGANTEHYLSNRAVEETNGIVAIYDWNLILAQYSSTAGGYSESFENTFSDPKTKEFPSKPKPYLKAKPDYPDVKPLNKEADALKFYKSRPKSFDVNSSYFRWQRQWTAEEFQNEIQNHIAAQSMTGFITPAVQKGEIIGKINKINVIKRGDSGKIITMEIQTDKGNYTVNKELVIRRLITCKGKALPSANVVFEQEFDKNGKILNIKAYGGGFGHGVGLSQYGAGYMATVLKMPYEKILQHYYTGISLTTLPFTLTSNGGQDKITQKFFTKNAHGKLVLDNKYKSDYIDIKINNKTERITLDTTKQYIKIDLSPYLKRGQNTLTFYYPLDTGKNKAMRGYIELAGKNEYSK